MIDHCCFRNLRTAVHLSGFSGAIIALIHENGATEKVVRKASATPSGSARLQEQADLQKKLRDLLDAGVHVPQILNEGVIDGCYWYDMEQIRGVDAIEYLSTGKREHVWNLRNRLQDLLTQLSFAQQGESTDSEKIDLQAGFHGKLEEIDFRTRNRFGDVTDKIRAAIEGPATELEATFAHGDLTLENIFVQENGNLSLIDTIPSPFRHHLVDISKIFQDLEGRWFLHRGRSVPLSVTHFLSESMFDFAAGLVPEYERWHGPMLALTFARILPYCKTDTDLTFARSRILNALSRNTTGRTAP